MALSLPAARCARLEVTRRLGCRSCRSSRARWCSTLPRSRLHRRLRLDGYLQPHEDVNLEITFDPPKPNRDIRWRRLPVAIRASRRSRSHDVTTLIEPALPPRGRELTRRRAAASARASATVAAFSISDVLLRLTLNNPDARLVLCHGCRAQRRLPRRRLGGVELVGGVRLRVLPGVVGRYSRHDRAPIVVNARAHQHRKGRRRRRRRAGDRVRDASA